MRTCTPSILQQLVRMINQTIPLKVMRRLKLETDCQEQTKEFQIRLAHLIYQPGQYSHPLIGLTLVAFETGDPRPAVVPLQLQILDPPLHSLNFLLDEIQLAVQQP